ncbi:hypothetical protein R3Q06_18730 [Rhodococcus erythropolis]|uniref:hypothetical protein n=1 Tax=Rhodococcus erythropolis TaxID=1833 RepID=UPI002948D533|nr:hypothetical protein [Rhodococcus erythropolis]MDV6275536.1 hypothetical protein [Rhodococcus erythropolis]
MTDIRERVDLHPPRLDESHTRCEPDVAVTMEFDPTPLVRAVVTRLRVALDSDSGRKALEAMPAEVDLHSTSDPQRARLTRTATGVHVSSPEGSAVSVVGISVDELAISEDEPLAGTADVAALSTLVEPEPPTLDVAACEFWEKVSGLSGMPGLSLNALDTGAVVHVGPATDAYEIHGLEIDLRRLMAGFELFVYSLRAGKFYIKGTHRQLSVVAGASMKAVLHV